MKKLDKKLKNPQSQQKGRGHMCNQDICQIRPRSDLLKHKLRFQRKNRWRLVLFQKLKNTVELLRPRPKAVKYKMSCNIKSKLSCWKLKKSNCSSKLQKSKSKNNRKFWWETTNTSKPKKKMTPLWNCGQILKKKKDD